MKNGTQRSRSIAADLALLSLAEPRIVDDPELLVSTEAVLSFAAIKNTDPVQWAYWRSVLERYNKAALIEHLLRDPACIEDSEWKSAADRLIGLAQDEGLEPFHDADQQGWASVRVSGHWENHPIRSRDFQLFLLRTYYGDTGRSPGGRVIRAAQELFEARALFDGPESRVPLRVAEHRGSLYLDLCDRSWRAVQIDNEGWRVVDKPEPKFRRTRGSQPLPAPERGGSLEELRPFFNVDHHGWTLIKAFLVGALRPGLPCPILVVKGEQGAGKSTACRVITSLIDPRTSALRGVPRDVRDLTAAARNSWLVCFDNLSHLSDELADAACRLATGGGFGGRQLYSDHDEAVFDAIRPLVFNAIPDIGTARPDFIDRAVVIEFLDMTAEMRRDEGRFWYEFEKVRPRILGGLADTVASGLRNLPALTYNKLPRMADFAIWVSACETALGLEQGEALAALQANFVEARNLVLEASPVYEPLRDVARKGFSGTSSELLTLLSKLANDNVRRSQRWPKAPNALSNAVRRMSSSLRLTGIEICFNRMDRQGRRVISVKSVPLVSKRSSASSARD